MANIMGWIHKLPADIQAEYFNSLTRSAFSKNVYIYHQGEKANSCYFLFEGSVQLRTSSTDGKQALVNVINAGQVLGETAVIDGGTRVYDAITVEQGLLGTMSGHRFNEMRRQYSVFNDAVTSLLIQQIRRTVTLYNQATLWSLEKRVIAILQRHRQPQAGFITLSQEEIGHSLGVTRQSIHRIVKKLVLLKLVEITHRRIRTIDTSALAQHFMSLK